MVGWHTQPVLLVTRTVHRQRSVGSVCRQICTAPSRRVLSTIDDNDKCALVHYVSLVGRAHKQTHTPHADFAFAIFRQHMRTSHVRNSVCAICVEFDSLVHSLARILILFTFLMTDTNTIGAGSCIFHPLDSQQNPLKGQNGNMSSPSFVMYFSRCHLSGTMPMVATVSMGMI